MTTTAPALRLAFYGDDFTGSTDALEVLAFAGLRCALFLDVPTEASLRDLGGFDAIGVAGASRAMTPPEMDARLPAVLAALAALPVSIVHYKVCSTFDSAPGVGSIGRVMDLARAAFGPGLMPIVAATPALGRYCAFGNLHARSATDGRVHRIDRHPIMSVHPVTPMHEGDLGLHLNAQTKQRIAGLQLPWFALGAAERDAEIDRLAAGAADAVLLDGAEPSHLTEAGRLIERLAAARRERPLFAVGSSGLEYAMTQWWAESAPRGTRADVDRYAQFDPVGRVLAISGSASALSARQVDAAVAAGFADIAVDAKALAAGERWQDTLDTLVERSVAALRDGRSVVLHTARGHDDPRIDALVDALATRGLDRATARLDSGRLLGQRLGLLTDRILRAVSVPRLLLSGGDTSSLVTQQLAPRALEVIARLSPGAPLCLVRSDAPHLRGLQIALKGGQMGGPDYFVKALRGTR